MGTRGAYGFILGEAKKITYNHFDSYPDGLGRTMVQFVANSHSIAELEYICRGIQLVKEDAKPTAEQVKECAEYSNFGVSTQSPDDWYCLLRNAQGEPEAYRKGLRYMIDSQNFMKDGLWCEYAYVIDLDKNLLRFYMGRATGRKDKDGERKYSLKQYSAIHLADIISGITTEDEIITMWERLSEEQYAKSV